MIRNVINDVTLRWRLSTCFKKNVESTRLDGPSLRRRLQKLFQSTLVHSFILSGENITRYAKDISIFMVEFSLFYSGKVHFWLYLCHLGLYIFRSGIPYAVDFTLSFDTSFAPIEALLDVRTLTFTAKTVFF